MKSTILTVAILFISVSVFAWGGYDYDTGTFIEIEQGNLVRSGSDIEIYNYGTNEYHEVEVDSVTQYGSTVEIEIYDYDTGEYSVIEMDGY